MPGFVKKAFPETYRSNLYLKPILLNSFFIQLVNDLVVCLGLNLILKQPVAFAGITLRASFPTSIEVIEIIDGWKCFVPLSKVFLSILIYSAFYAMFSAYFKRDLMKELLLKTYLDDIH